MINGRFGDTTGRPYVQGRLALPHLNVWAYCSFIVDTGAEKSVLVPVDARRMRLDRSQLSNPATSLGIGGECQGHEELGFLVLSDDERQMVYNFRVSVFIPEETPEMLEIDGSILGRDVLDHVVLEYDGPGRTVRIDVREFSESYSSAPAPGSVEPGGG